MTPFDHFPGWDQIEPFSMSSEELDAAFEEVMKRSRTLEVYLARERSIRRTKYLRVIFSVAAVCALILLPVFSVRYARRTAPQNQVAAVNYIQRSTSCGETAEVILPDHSRVLLNAQSVLIYPETFQSERTVFLSGEAIFDVTASEEDAFYVQTSDLVVKVHGTRFDVKAYFDDPMVTATLNRGAIAAWPKNAPERVVELEPEQYCALERSTGALVHGRANSSESMSWEGGNLCFHSESIHEIIRIIQRHYGVQVYLTTSKYDKARISARFIHGETVDELLDAICSVVPSMRYSRTDDAIYIR